MYLPGSAPLSTHAEEERRRRAHSVWRADKAGHVEEDDRVARDDVGDTVAILGDGAEPTPGRDQAGIAVVVHLLSGLLWGSLRVQKTKDHQVTKSSFIDVNCRLSSCKNQSANTDTCVHVHVHVYHRIGSISTHNYKNPSAH